MTDRFALDARGVSKRYAHRAALCGVDLAVEPGRLHGLLGRNGAGKTTLMRVVLGLVQRDAGSVRVLGLPLHRIGEPLPDGVAGLIEAPAFYPYLSGRKNLALLARLDDGGRSTRQAIDRVLDDAGLMRDADVLVGRYSAGMRQRLGLAAALLRSPRLLVLDEPTSALDPVVARDVRALVRHLTAHGTAVVLSSHDLAEVEAICDGVTVIDGGRVVFDGSVDELRALAPDASHTLHTSDDAAAIWVACGRRNVQVTRGADGGLEVTAAIEALDAYVIALGRAGVAIRALDRRARSLESSFLNLTRPEAVAS